MIIGVVAIALIAIAVSYFFLRPVYVPVFTNLSPQDSATLVAQLESAKTPYRLDPVSGAVLVPADQLEKIRTALAGRGFPLKNSVGFELFDSGDFGMTEFTEKINYQRALEGELERTIMQIEGVRYARIHLVLPESGLFKRDRDPPKASVLLVTNADNTLAHEQVTGIQKMVASAVPGLSPEMVSVHDHRGVNLAQGDAASHSDTGISAKEAYEVYLSSKIYGILGHLYPEASFAVSVDATLRSGRMSSTRDEVLPSSEHAVAPRIHAESKESGPDLLGKMSNGETPPIGPPPGLPPSSNTEYPLGHFTEQSEEAPGQVERLSVGVLVPDPLPDGTSIQDLRDLIAAAAGLQIARGDRIAVYSAILPKAAAPKAVQASHPVVEDTHSPASIATGKKRSDTSTPPQLWMFFAGTAALILVIWTAGLAFRPSPKSLSTAERLALLERVKDWLKEDGLDEKTSA